MRYNRGMTQRSTPLLLLLSVAAALAHGPTARADEKPDYELAKKHYLTARDAIARKDFEAAVHEYILAYDIVHDPSLFKMIGGAYDNMGKRLEAAVYYRRYLAEAKNAADADEVRAKLAAVQGAPASAKPPAPASAPAREPSKPVAPPPERPATQPAEAEPPEPPKLPPPEPPSPTQASPEMRLSQPPLPAFSESESHWQRTTGWVFVGLTAVGVTTGAVLAASAKAREDDINQLIAFRDPTTGQPNQFSGSTKDDYLNKVDEGKNLSTLSTVAFIGAGACAGTAVLFFILDATRDVPNERVSVAPFVAPGGGGFAAGWGF
jgi:hypothetical protein